MGGTIWIELIFLAVITGILILRLRSVLGERHGEERQRPNPFEHSVPPSGQDAPDFRADETASAPHDAPKLAQAANDEPGSVAAGLTQIRMADSAFDPDSFLAGATQAFHMIVTAFAEADRETLRNMLSDEIYDAFVRVVDARDTKGHKASLTLHGPPEATITDADMRGRNAYVTVLFTSRQTLVVRDESGAVVEGDPDTERTVKDLWTFGRDTQDDDPNWSLVGTRGG